MMPIPLRCALQLVAILSLPPAVSAAWYPFAPTNVPGPSAIGMEEWSPDPAGAGGRVEVVGDRLVYRGAETKLWGLNVCYLACAPDRELADRRAAMYRKFGFNAVRLHKFADGTDWAGILRPESALAFDEALLDRMDYFVAALKRAGIYVKLSPTFGVKFTARDAAERGPWLAEFGDFTRSGRVRAPFGAVFLAEEIQDIQIEQTLHVLNHRNPHTGLRYADDPAVFCVEMFNEDSVLFGGVVGSLQRSPTLRARIARQFSEWLEKKYGSETAWRAAWGEGVILRQGAINPHLGKMIDPPKVVGGLADEDLRRRTVVPWSHPWFGDAAVREGSEQGILRVRLLDTMQFLIGLQDAFYARFARAIRATGFSGAIISSNWQAGSLVGHLLNLHSDAQFSLVDRHNYFGGGRGALNRQAPFRPGSMLIKPGWGTLSAGLQQVEGKPFMLSEWIHVAPNEWGAEGPAILGAYGFGLQGWDVSYLFQNGDSGGFSERIARDSWDVTSPVILGMMPAVSRQVRRRDVREARRTIPLNVHLPDLLEGRLGFAPRTIQSHDEKSFTTDRVPHEALAVSRVAVAFTPESRETETFAPLPVPEDGSYRSDTGELAWTPAREGDRGGFFTLSSERTKAFVGFAPGDRTFDLGDGFLLRPGAGFAAIYLTAKGPNESLKDAREIVIVAMARARNTGQRFNEEGNVLLEAGTPPILLEPVSAELTTPRGGRLGVLDHDGVSLMATRDPARRHRIDGSADRSPFYLWSVR